MTVVLADHTDRGFFPDHQQLADDIDAEITWAIGQPGLGVDPAKIATAGHSLGGKLSILVAADDPRVGAVVAWDPVDGGSAPTLVPGKLAGLHAALAVIGETTDGSGGAMPCAPATRRLDVAWLRRRLLGDTAMDAWLAMPPEIAAGVATVERK